MTDEYDPEELEQLVNSALTEIAESPRHALFSFGDTRLLQHLDEVLGEYINRAEAATVLATLREKLYADMAGHKDVTKSLRGLHGAVTNCRVCPNVVADPQLPKWNLNDPDVAFVLDTPLQNGDPDKFFVNTLKEVGFRSARLMVTSVIRCRPDANRQPAAEEVTACSTRYLFSELQLLQPKLIVALGGIPTSTILADKIKITEVHGTIFWAGPWPILAAYSPAYAMRTERQQSEFKNDIQRAHEYLYGK